MVTILKLVDDSTFDEIRKQHFDLAVYASGYERRASYLAKQLEPAQIDRTLVLGFEQESDDPQRVENDRLFLERWTDTIVRISSDEDGPIYDALREFEWPSSTANILIDYSSMSRLWYAGILNWVRHSAASPTVNLWFSYAVPTYAKIVRPLSVINRILAIPGMEGRSMPFAQSVAIFGLGFDEYVTLAVLDRLEPDVVYSFFAGPGATPAYTSNAKRLNSELIKFSNATVEIPLRSVRFAFTRIAELISPHYYRSDVTLIPLGPKPHVLASLLAATRFDRVGCLRVSRMPAPPLAAVETGEIVATVAEFKAS